MNVNFLELTKDTINPDEMSKIYGGIYTDFEDQRSACTTSACSASYRATSGSCTTSVCYSRA